jgi:hypothetical protein
MTASETQLRNMLFDVLDYIDPLMDQMVSLDRMHVERIKEMSGWQKQPQAEATPYADVFQPRPGLLGLIVRGANMGDRS